MTLVYAYRNRGITRGMVLHDSGGRTVVPSEGDALRVTIGRDGSPPKLIVSSEEPTANGSTILLGETSLLRLDASDLTFDAGVYTLTLDYFDSADSREWKCVDRQVFVLEDA